MTSIPARDIRPGHLIIRHPDHPERSVRLLVVGRPKPVRFTEVSIDYTAKPDERPGMVANGPGSGTLVVDEYQDIEILDPSPVGGAA